ncbi:MAG: hypothetical protein ABL967_04795 [Bryobacteraceae bacterium]
MLSFAIAPVRNAIRRVLLTIVATVLVAAPIFAHGGFDHVAGNVVKVSADTLTLQTSTGVVEVKLDAKTAITKEKQKAQRTDLVPGVRVTVDIPEGNKDKLAHAVKISNAAPDAHSGHAGH